MQQIEQIFANKYFQFVIIVGLAITTAAIIIEPNFYLVKLLSNYAFYIMLLQLSAGFFFMIVKSNRLMFISFFCCGILCLFLKNAGNNNIVLPERNVEAHDIHVGLFNVTRFTDSLDPDIDLIQSTNSDILFFHEVTPEWKTYLQNELSAKYPYSYFHIRIDPFGQAIFSKTPILQVDTVYFDKVSRFGGIPSLGATFELNNDTIRCTSIHSLPPSEYEGYEKLSSHLNLVGSKLLNNRFPNFIFAYLNVPAWNAEVKKFKQDYRLNDSRRVSKLFKMPFEHLFYSQNLECVEFIEQQVRENYIGLTGSFQKIVKVEESMD